jgi:hypothetical protein
MKDLTRKELNDIATKKGLDAENYRTKADVIEAIEALEKAEVKETVQSKTENVKQLPQYESIKRVSALKILEVRRNNDGTVEITPKDKGYEPFKVDAHYARRFNPRAGGYYIVYSNGTPSYQDATFFENGYNKVK